VFKYTRIHSLLVNGVITVSNHALWRVLSNIVIWLLGHFRVDTSHTNTFEGDSVFKMTLLEAPTGTLLFYYKDIKQEIVHALLLEEYGVSKKWVIIMDRRQDLNVTLTPARKNAPSAQDRYCARGCSCFGCLQGTSKQSRSCFWFYYRAYCCSKHKQIYHT